jgi:ribokinase
MKNKVVVIGSYNTDLTIKTERIPRSGETIIGGIYSEGGGGKGANQAVAAARAGASVSFIARVGSDALGKEGIRRLTNESINTQHMVYDAHVSTGVAFIVVDERGENSIVVASGANARLSPADIEAAENDIASAAVVLLQLESPIETVRAAVTKARDHRAIVILNPAPAQPLPESIYPAIDYITPNETETAALTGVAVSTLADAEKAAGVFLARGVRNVIITLGRQGAFVKNALVSTHVPAIDAGKAVETAGAGDAFNGCLAVALSEGMDLVAATRFGCAAAAISITRLGTAPSMPTRAEIDELLK